ncbi:MAG: amidohydrolase family protein [Armatimonadetes bacterium]|nr:amidohydrolase family protein [Armatimonadota bacterium]
MAAQSGLPIVDCNTWVGFYPRQAIDLSPQVLLSIMKRYGVARALFVHTTAVFYDARTGNDLAVQVAKESGGLLIPVASINPMQYRGIGEEIDRRLQQGFRLFRFFPQWQNWQPKVAPFRELVNILTEKGVPFLIDCPKVGWATEIADLVQDKPLTVVLSDVSEVNMGEVLCVVKSLPNIYLETSCIIQPDGYDLVADEIGVDKLVFGSNAPLHYFASALFPLLHSALSDEDKRKVLVENLRRIVQA